MDLSLLCQCICQVICCIIILLYGILILIFIVLLHQLLVCFWVILLQGSQDMLLASLLQDALQACQMSFQQAELLPVLKVSILQGALRMCLHRECAARNAPAQSTVEAVARMSCQSMLCRARSPHLEVGNAILRDLVLIQLQPLKLWEPSNSFCYGDCTHSPNLRMHSAAITHSSAKSAMCMHALLNTSHLHVLLPG